MLQRMSSRNKNMWMTPYIHHLVLPALNPINGHTLDVGHTLGECTKHWNMLQGAHTYQVSFQYCQLTWWLVFVPWEETRVFGGTYILHTECPKSISGFLAVKQVLCTSVLPYDPFKWNVNHNSLLWINRNVFIGVLFRFKGVLCTLFQCLIIFSFKWAAWI